jgi:hypothetical protein
LAKVAAAPAALPKPKAVAAARAALAKPKPKAAGPGCSKCRFSARGCARCR